LMGDVAGAGPRRAAPTGTGTARPTVARARAAAGVAEAEAGPESTKPAPMDGTAVNATTPATAHRRVRLTSIVRRTPNPFPAPPD
jgi:hypothetical protein